MGADPCCRPSLTPRARAAARPALTRSRIRSRSNSAKPAILVRVGLPLAVLRSEAEARLSQDANFPAVQVVEGLDEVLSFCGSTLVRTEPPPKPTEDLMKRQNLRAFIRTAALRMSRVQRPMEPPDPMPKMLNLDSRNSVGDSGRSPGPVHTVHMDLICPS